MAAMLRHSRICTQHFVSWRHDTLRSVRSWRDEENQTRDRGNSWGRKSIKTDHYVISLQQSSDENTSSSGGGLKYLFKQRCGGRLC